MSDRENPNLARHVRVDVSEARVDRLWARVSERVVGLPRRLSRWVWVGATACAVAAGVLVVHVVDSSRGPTASAWEGAQLETAADALSVTLVDGSNLRLEPRSRVEVGDRTESALKLVLAKGRIACDVTHRPERSFVVAAGGVQVRVVGTRFSVSNEQLGDDASRVEVKVERGTVEVRGVGPDAQTVRIEAGRSWSQVTRTAPLEPEVQPEAEEVAPSAPLAPTGGKPRAPAAGRARPATGEARELFEQARGLWRGGRMEAAAEKYQELLDNHPRDPRAGIAAFELGRLRMDRLGDMRGAMQALEQAVALAPGAEFREDALARLVAASAGAHDGAGCTKARDRYLAAYPTGVHRRTVAAACGSR